MIIIILIQLYILDLHEAKAKLRMSVGFSEISYQHKLGPADYVSIILVH